MAPQCLLIIGPSILVREQGLAALMYGFESHIACHAISSLVEHRYNESVMMKKSNLAREFQPAECSRHRIGAMQPVDTGECCRFRLSQATGSQMPACKRLRHSDNREIRPILSRRFPLNQAPLPFRRTSPYKVRGQGMTVRRG